jgi:ABC-type glycerol-3-phosphate transport system permease component
VLLILTLVPVILMLTMSLKNRGQIFTQFWALPRPPLWENYVSGWNGMRSYIFNSLLFGALSVLGVVFLSSLAGYVFARHRFPGKEMIYLAILALLMIPGVLTLIPASCWAQLGSWIPWALILRGRRVGIRHHVCPATSPIPELFEAGGLTARGCRSARTWRCR